MKIKSIAFYLILADVIPPDMLRYDTAFINDSAKAGNDRTHVVAFPRFVVPKVGGYGGRVTEGRWNSFCIRDITPYAGLRWIGNSIVASLDCSLSLSGVESVRDWYTYMHPERDYTTLVKVPLINFIDAKTDRDIKR